MRKSHINIAHVLLVILSVPIIGMSTIEMSKLLGLRTIPVPVVGTGSMYPSLFWSTEEGGPEDESKIVVEEYRSTPHLYLKFKGINLFGYSFLKRKIEAGDMVAFKNDKTREVLQKDGKNTSAGFIKRVIALSGDQVELRDGFVYKNNKLILEPYIAAPRSTYGGSSLKDCEIITIPPGKIFVLGDNRKVSLDSRFELGLIDEFDIEFILPLTAQQHYRSLWRDTSKDDELLGQPTLVASDFLSLVNEVRKKHSTSSLKLVKELSTSTTKRGEELLKNPDSAKSISKSMTDAGYSNIVVGEFVSHGHFSAKELLENLLYTPSTAKQIINSDYSDLGLTAVNLVVDGCPSQIIVGHLGGYVPATYDQKTIESWQDLRKSLAEVLPTWEKAMSYDNLDKQKLTELLTILRRRLALADNILHSMANKEWLTGSQDKQIKDDVYDSARAESLARELNQQ